MCDTILVGIGIDERNLSKLRVYPNPSKGIINIDLGETQKQLKASLINSLGQTILTQNYKSVRRFEMNIDAPIGIYFLQIETNDGATKTIKVVKE